MRFLADVNLSRRALRLRVTFEAKIVVALHQHFRVHRPVRLVTGYATVAHRLVLEHVRLRLLAMALCAGLVQTRHGQPACRFHDVKAMRVVALHAIHVALGDGVMMRQVELRVCLQVARVAGGRVTAGIDDESATAATDLNMPASRAMACLAARVPRGLDRLEVDARMRASREGSHIIRMAFVAILVADEGRALNLRRGDEASLQRGA